MKKLTLVIFFASGCLLALAQTPDRIKNIFPEGTIIHSNIPYANDTLKHHLLDIYLPGKSTGNLPLVIWVHGGAWNHNDKYADMGYMKNTLKGILDHGYALASIDYRYSTQAIFPAQIQDCNEAVEFLYQHAREYSIDKNKIVLAGFSAGGHLASLLALSGNDDVKAFYPKGKKPSFKIAGVLDFYGPSDFVAISDGKDGQSSEAILLGATPSQRPDLARAASPVTYVNKNDPPFLIVHGEKDESVPHAQSVLLSKKLSDSGVKNELIIVKNAPHYGIMFDEESIRAKVFDFLGKNFN